MKALGYGTTGWRAALAALAIALALAFAPGIAEAQSVNPTASAVQEQQLLRALQGGQNINGRVTIPDANSRILIQPEGQSWRAFHQGTLTNITTIAILGMIALLALFYFTRGRITIEAGPSGRTITRFGGFERFVHWLTAGSFVVLALSGLNITVGKYVLLPLFGPETFTAVSQLGKYAHNYLAFPFMLGIALMLVIWIKDNIPNSVDMAWFKAGGGLLKKGEHPPAGRFNGGQKLVFWIVVIGGTALSLSGWFLLFPFSGGYSVTDQQFWNTIHAVVSVLMIAAMLAHAYIGSIGMEGAFDAMGSGEVDLNWAREHHSLWVEEEMSRGRAPGAMQPAE